MEADRELLEIGKVCDVVAGEDAELEIVDPYHICKDNRRELSRQSRLNSSSIARAENIQHASKLSTEMLEIEEL